MKDAFANSKKSPTDTFLNVVLPKFPPVLNEWFFSTFSVPTKWLKSRKSFTSTCATMSIVGYIVGLGDRHGENILLDETTGECLHVDLNCLFEKGLDFEIPERVPFRLTHNMVDAFGIYGIEGPYRKCCEVTMRVLRDHRELLMSVLETFLHDPLCEWNKSKSRSRKDQLDFDQGQNPLAIKSLQAIDRKLLGYINNLKLPMSVAGQVEYLIRTATDPENLSRMYIGWAPYL